MTINLGLKGRGGESSTRDNVQTHGGGEEKAKNYRYTQRTVKEIGQTLGNAGMSSPSFRLECQVNLQEQ